LFFDPEVLLSTCSGTFLPHIPPLMS
jgi:hypothetical protein